MGKTPISIEDLINSNKKKEEEKSKPVFLSKKERHRRALERLKEKHQTKQSQTLTTITSTLTNNDNNDNNDNEYENEYTNNHLLKKQKLITKKNPINKNISKKFSKFNFEWDKSEDTGIYQPLYHLNILNKKNNDLNKLELKISKNGNNNYLPWRNKTKLEMKERDWRIFREEFNIQIKGKEINNMTLPTPLRSWEESNIPKPLLSIIQNIGYLEPTPIQRAAIPIALSNRDVLGIAQTGSGKTASFIIPLLSHIIDLPPLNEITKTNGPYAIILAPVRELAQQIASEAEKFCKPLGFNVVSIIGGHNLETQAYNVQQGAEIVVATPGRLLDVLGLRVIVLRQCCYVILDEADRMIEQGFGEQVQTILQSMADIEENDDDDEIEKDFSTINAIMKKKRQTMMYTATMPPTIEKIANEYLNNPVIVTIGDSSSAVDTVEQLIEFIPEHKRIKRLKEILGISSTSSTYDRYGDYRYKYYEPPIIIFVNFKKHIDPISSALNNHGFKVVTIHGDKSQDQRELALQQLKTHKADILIGTDVAGRGLDINDVSLVINYQMANNMDSYTHRIGRTGRAGKKGTSITFLGKEDEPLFYDLKQALSNSPVSKVPSELRRHPAAQVKGGMSNGASITQ